MSKKIFAWEDSHFSQFFPGSVFESALAHQFKKTSLLVVGGGGVYYYYVTHFYFFFLLVTWLCFLVLGRKTKLFEQKINGASLITLRLVLFFEQKFTHEPVTLSHFFASAGRMGLFFGSLVEDQTLRTDYQWCITHSTQVGLVF